MFTSVHCPLESQDAKTSTTDTTNQPPGMSEAEAVKSERKHQEVKKEIDKTARSSAHDDGGGGGGGEPLHKSNSEVPEGKWSAGKDIRSIIRFLIFSFDTFLSISLNTPDAYRSVLFFGPKVMRSSSMFEFARLSSSSGILSSFNVKLLIFLFKLPSCAWRLILSTSGL